MMNVVHVLLLFGFALLRSKAAAECPFMLQHPCTCTSSRYESVSIVCDKGESFSQILHVLSRPPGMIDSLTISNTPIGQLPALAFIGLQVKRLVLRNNGLHTIDPQAFTGPILTSLEELEIRSNQLPSIPQSGVNQIRTLRSLSLSDNAITTVENNAFLSYQSRANIRRLDLSANNMSVIYPQGFLGLETIEQLSLDKNRLRFVPEEALVNLPTLEELSLGVNEIETIPVGALQLPNLKSLSLEVNKIRNIAPDALQTLPNLAYLYLSSNLFTTIESTMLFYVNNLKVLSMGNNHELRIIPGNAFQYTPLLVRLELPECSVSVIEPTALHKIPKVQVINLARNRLTHISHDTFTALPALVNIDLSGNQISSIDDFSFSQLPALSILDLSANRLENLPPNVIYHSLLPSNLKQRHLYLQNNPWRCDRGLDWLRQWLRENDRVLVAKNGEEARCWTPSTSSGVILRQLDPIPPAAGNTIDTSAVVPGDRMRKLIKTPTVTATSVVVDYPPVVLGSEDAKPSSTSIAVLILVIVFGILALCITLIMIIRCIMKSREEKREGSSRFGGDSITSSGFAGSGYSTTGIFPEHCHPHGAGAGAGAGIAHLSPPGAAGSQMPTYLNRPRYWWF